VSIWARNIPLPEPHLIGVVAGLAAGWVSKWTLPLPLWLGIAGLVLTIAGLALAAWATWASRDTHLAQPDQLIVRGPYAASRNPMYVGWTLAYLGLIGMLGSGWLLVLLPAVLFGTHIAVRREERRLLTHFGDTYATYAARVRRYV
jgi:protein-S-isoprenylcysteine O-methyltransferase Ste14